MFWGVINVWKLTILHCSFNQILMTLSLNPFHTFPFPDYSDYMLTLHGLCSDTHVPFVQHESLFWKQSGKVGWPYSSWFFIRNNSLPILTNLRSSSSFNSEVAVFAIWLLLIGHYHESYALKASKCLKSYYTSNFYNIKWTNK